MPAGGMGRAPGPPGNGLPERFAAGAACRACSTIRRTHAGVCASSRPPRARSTTGTPYARAILYACPVPPPPFPPGVHPITTMLGSRAFVPQHLVGVTRHQPLHVAAQPVPGRVVPPAERLCPGVATGQDLRPVRPASPEPRPRQVDALVPAHAVAALLERAVRPLRRPGAQDHSRLRHRPPDRLHPVQYLRRGASAPDPGIRLSGQPFLVHLHRLPPGM